ncbi:MAG: hypothetical protein A2W36_02775 [Chloroflexi bacterium RBG_16_58_14]|nr:MAG: hypothetical protein A2W36_02775 [Chloroflexi bacterium RBG_16_58_14]
MSELRQALLGILVALISSSIVLGSIALALTEGRKPLAQAPLPTHTMNPLLLTPVDTPAPGEPTFTSSPSPLPPSTATLQPTPRCQPPPGWQQVDILPGDTLELLATLYGIPMEELRQRNCLPTGELQAGTFIFAPGQTPTPAWTATQTATPEQPSQAKKPPARCGPPGGWVIYIVRRGDTLSRIAVLTNTTVAQLQKANCLGSSTTIRVGQRLYVPHLPPIQVPTRTPTRRPPTATPTHLPSGTLSPTVPSTPVPTDTPTSTPLPSDTPLPTTTPLPSETPLPTPTQTPTNTPVTPTA